MSIKSKIESLLFISAKPMTVNQLAGLLKKSSKEVETAGEELVQTYKESGGGIQIIKNGSKYQMVSSAENADLVQEFIKDETTGELTRPSLEALTIIAYRGPISKIELDRIRGVNCALIIRNLLLRGLIDGRQDKIKKETYYSVTLDFIRFLGINDIRELPDYEKLNKDDMIDRVLNGFKDPVAGPENNAGNMEAETEEAGEDLTDDEDEEDEEEDEFAGEDEDQEDADEDDENKDDLSADNMDNTEKDNDDEESDECEDEDEDEEDEEEEEAEDDLMATDPEEDNEDSLVDPESEDENEDEEKNIENQSL